MACIRKFKNWNSNSQSERGNSGRPATGPRPQNNQSETNHHARDDITAPVYNDVSRERPVDFDQQHKSQSSEYAGHRIQGELESASKTEM